MKTWAAWITLVAILATSCGGGYRIVNTEQHSDQQGTQWAHFDVVTQETGKAELRKIALAIKDDEAAKDDVAYLVFKGSEAAGGGSVATIVNSERGLEKHKEIVPSWQHGDAKKAVQHGGVYVWAME
jgi:hypothetical protein